MPASPAPFVVITHAGDLYACMGDWTCKEWNCVSINYIYYVLDRCNIYYIYTWYNYDNNNSHRIDARGAHALAYVFNEGCACPGHHNYVCCTHAMRTSSMQANESHIPFHAPDPNEAMLPQSHHADDRPPSAVRALRPAPWSICKTAGLIIDHESMHVHACMQGEQTRSWDNHCCVNYSKMYCSSIVHAQEWFPSAPGEDHHIDEWRLNCPSCHAARYGRLYRL